ncbi:hypothetical protein VNI00_015249 [Paramarasmius palmivorus]|uniref:Uncharacterized protein n=1 Tax=Paramarasmius palmivorus TaxID=297713 RepID=A0AAW0BMU8_9AGAR
MPAKKTTSSVKGAAKAVQEHAPTRDGGAEVAVEQGVPETTTATGRGRIRKASGNSIEQSSGRGGRGAKTEKGKSGGPSRVIVLDDDDGSDVSSVSVSRRALKDVPAVGRVKQFGSVDSDEFVTREVHLVARQSRPRKRSPSLSSLSSVGSGGEGVAVESPAASVSGSRSVPDKAPVVASVPSVVVPLTPEKRRRSGDDDGVSPSKIRVKDLTLSPRKAAKAISGAVFDLQGGSKRRVADAKNDRGSDTPSVLLARLDALPDPSDDQDPVENVTESTRQASTSARRGKSAHVIQKPVKDRKDPVGEEVPDSDSSMVSPTVSRVPTPCRVSCTRSPTSRRKRRGAERDLVFDSDDTLPSPTSVLASKSRVSTGESKSERGSQKASVGKRKALDPPGSPKWDIEDMDVDDPPEDSRRGRGGKGGTERPGAGSSIGRKATVRVPAAALPANTRTSAQDPPAVFSTALSLPEDEDEDYTDFEADVEPAREPLLDPERIHPNLLQLYASFPWIDGLKRAKFIGYANTEGVFGDFTPVSYARLLDAVDARVMSKLTRSIGFVQYKDFKSPVRVPLAGFARNWECIRVPRKEGTRSAAFVLTGVSTSSHVSVGREVGQSFVKQIHVRPLENDWTVLQCNIGTFLNDAEMHAPGRNNALVFQTKRQGWVARAADKEQDPLGSTPYPSPAKPGSSKAVEENVLQDEEGPDVAMVNVLGKGAPPFRTFDEGIPLYDGRTRPGVKGFRFGPDDWESYTNLPLYPHAEVEDQSLVTVVFTLAGFKIGSALHHTVHFNALFAIVLGKVKL